jgi:hypothetical protein
MAALNIPNLDYSKLEKQYIDRNAAIADPQKHWKIVGVDDFMHEFIYKIAIANPMWRFEATGVSRLLSNDEGGAEFELNSFDVYEKRELLGRISKERNYTRREDVYCLRNKRIADERERGSELKTGNQAKALKAVKKYFSLAKPVEVIEDKISKAMQSLRAIERGKETSIDYVWMDKRREVKQYMLERWGEFLATLPNPKDYEINMLANVQEHEMVDKMRRDAIDSKMYEVVAVDSTYYVRFKDDVKVVDSTSLPEHLRGKLGMLKLVEVGAVVEGVGYRAADDTFLISGESNDLQG